MSGAQTVVSTMLRKGGRTVKVVKARGTFGLDNSNVREVVTIDLPVPPSLNNIFISVGNRRVKSPDYLAWIAEAGWRLSAQRPGRVAGTFEARLELPARTLGDIDNRYKAVGDLLVKHGVTEDDSRKQRLVIERSTDVTEARVTIRAMAKVAA